jgi:glycosidase
LPRGEADWAHAGWWNDAVFYQVFVRSFADSSTGPLAHDGIGDLPGLIERLDYLNDGDPRTSRDLGVTALWLMPIHPSGQYHGYDVRDFKAVNPELGTMDDFRRLLHECRRRGIRVVLDLVLNHVSSDHPWFVEARRDRESPYRDWFIWTDAVPGWRGPWNQQVWWRTDAAAGRRAPVRPGDADGPFYFGMFHWSMPDLNYRNPGVTAAMLEVTRFWLADVGVDGYRLDAIRHLFEDGPVHEHVPATHDWLRRFRRECREARPDAFTIGEVWSPTPQAARYVGDQLDAVFEFDLAYAMIESARTGLAGPFLDAQRRTLEWLPPGQYGRFLTNHDQPRVLTVLKGDLAAVRSAAMLLLLGPGIPFIYYGEEIGMTGDKPDPLIRTPMQWSDAHAGGFTAATPWQPLNPDHSWKNVAAQDHAPHSLLSLYRDLIRLRRSSPPLRHGLTTLLECDAPSVAAFFRVDPRHADRPVLVLINLADTPVSDYALSGPAGAAPGPLHGLERLAGAGPVALLSPRPDGSFDRYTPIAPLPPRSAFVIECSPPRQPDE